MIEPDKENNKYIIIAIIGLTIGWLLTYGGNAKAHDHKYNAIVTEVYDADTITVSIKKGFRETVEGEKIRLYGINAPEIKVSTKIPKKERLILKAKGIRSRDYLRSIILGKQIVLETVLTSKAHDKKGKFGRYLGVIWYNGVNINKHLVDKGYAVYKAY